jgi:hypothetical protein
MIQWEAVLSHSRSDDRRSEGSIGVVNMDGNLPQASLYCTNRGSLYGTLVQGRSASRSRVPLVTFKEEPVL